MHDRKSADLVAGSMTDCCWCPRPKRTPAVIHMWGRVWVCRECALKDGGLLGRRKVAIYDIDGDFSPANLKKLAATGIMDASAIFLPAGKISEEEWRERQRSIIIDEPVDIEREG